MSEETEYRRIPSPAMPATISRGLSLTAYERPEVGRFGETTDESVHTKRGSAWTGRNRLVAAIEYGLIVAGVLLVIPSKQWLTSDGRYRFEALNQLLSGDGFSEHRYSLIGPIFATPMYWLGRLGIADRGPDIWVRHYNFVLFSLSLLALFLLLRGRVHPVLLRRFLLLLVAGSMVAPHLTNFYGEVFTAVTVAVGFLVAVATVTHPVIRRLGWVAVVLGTANTAAVIPATGLVGAERSVATRRVRYLLPAVLAVPLVLGENWIRRGDPLDGGYGEEGFTFPIVLGVLAILVSFGKGLVFFAPGLFLPIRHRLTGLYDAARIDLWLGYKLWMVFVVGMILVYSKWWAWNGDVAWGPRFFLLAIFPASLALAVWLTRPDSRPWTDLVLLAVLGLSIWVGADSMVFEQLWPPHCYVDHTYCRFAIEDSRLWYPITTWPWRLSTTQWIQFGYHVVVFLWLAAPVTVRLFHAAIGWSRDVLAPRLRLAYWRW